MAMQASGDILMHTWGPGSMNPGTRALCYDYPEPGCCLSSGCPGPGPTAACRAFLILRAPGSGEGAGGGVRGGEFLSLVGGGSLWARGRSAAGDAGPSAKHSGTVVTVSTLHDTLALWETPPW